jgi:hypothetical protein
MDGTLACWMKGDPQPICGKGHPPYTTAKKLYAMKAEMKPDGKLRLEWVHDSSGNYKGPYYQPGFHLHECKNTKP